MPTVLVDVAPNAAAMEQLESMPGVSVRLVDPSDTVRSLPSEVIKDVDILFGTFPPANHEEIAGLKLVQITSVGYSQLYDHRLVERGVRACNARGVFDCGIAEWNIAMIINLLRDMRGMIRNQEHGIWDRPARFQAEANGMVVGIWGYGGIGRATARLAKALGLRVHAFARNGVGPRENTYVVPGTGDPEGVLPDQVFTRGQELEFLSGLDFLVLSIPQTPSTTGIIGERELEALPRGAFVLNPARGPLIKEEALLRALREEWIAGAALDTHYYYPMPADHPLWRFPNVIMTPHISGSDLSPHYNVRIWDIFIQNMRRFFAGQPLLNELTIEQLQGE